MLHLAGDIDLRVSPVVRHRIDSEIRATHGELAIDLRKVRYIDTVGIGMLVAAKRALAASQRDLRVIVTYGSSVEKIIRLSGLQDLFNLTPIAPVRGD
jgi:anti-anti-sigma factor